MALHIVSPLIESSPLSAHTGAQVFLKMDSSQPSGSFKIRGIGHICTKAVKERGATKLVGFSGGNAGLAVAYSAKQLGVKCVIVVPESTPSFMRDKIRDQGAEVTVYGAMLSICHEKAMEIIAAEPGAELVHPFDHPDIWEGHMSLILECSQQMKVRPTSIITVVGGGGLLIGILQSMHQLGWTDVPVFACETEGAESFAKSFHEKKLVKLDAITTIAKSLGAASVAPEAFAWISKHKIVPVVVQDKDSVRAIESFYNDHQVLVEPACAAGLSILYGDKVPAADLGSSVLVIVCGGNMISLDILKTYKEQFSL